MTSYWQIVFYGRTKLLFLWFYNFNFLIWFFTHENSLDWHEVNLNLTILWNFVCLFSLYTQSGENFLSSLLNLFYSHRVWKILWPRKFSHSTKIPQQNFFNQKIFTQIFPLLILEIISLSHFRRVVGEILMLFVLLEQS